MKTETSNSGTALVSGAASGSGYEFAKLAGSKTYCCKICKKKSR